MDHTCITSALCTLIQNASFSSCFSFLGCTSSNRETSDLQETRFSSKTKLKVKNVKKIDFILSPEVLQHGFNFTKPLIIFIQALNFNHCTIRSTKLLKPLNMKRVI